MSELVVSSLVFSEAGVEISFMELPDDARNDGTLVRQQLLMVAYASPLGGELTELREAVEEFTADALEAWQQGPVVQPSDELDEDAGMGGD